MFHISGDCFPAMRRHRALYTHASYSQRNERDGAKSMRLPVMPLQPLKLPTAHGSRVCQTTVTLVYSLISPHRSQRMCMYL